MSKALLNFFSYIRPSLFFFLITLRIFDLTQTAIGIRLGLYEASINPLIPSYGVIPSLIIIDVIIAVIILLMYLMTYLIKSIDIKSRLKLTADIILTIAVIEIIYTIGYHNLMILTS